MVKIVQNGQKNDGIYFNGSIINKIRWKLSESIKKKRNLKIGVCIQDGVSTVVKF